MSRRRKKHQEEAENHERWAIPYADLLTLLLAFFVVMYSISSVNAGKYRVLSDSLYAAFRGQPRSIQPIQIGQKRVGSGADLRITLVQQQIMKGQPRKLLDPVPLAVSRPILDMPQTPPPAAAANPPAPSGSAGPAHPQSAAARAADAAAAATLKRVENDVVRAMASLVAKKMVVVRRTRYMIDVEIRTDILFPSGSARLSARAIDIIRRLGAVLAHFPNPIRVEGFTDNVPIRTVQFYSNWELSAARAGSVVRVLAHRGVAPDRLAVVGYGDQHPIASNATPQGRNANRRVAVVILSTSLKSPDDAVWFGGKSRGAKSTPARHPPAPAPRGTLSASRS